MEKLLNIKYEIINALRNRIKEFLEYLEGGNRYSSELLLRNFQNEMENSSTDYQIVFSAYDSSSLIHSDIILKLFSEFCFRNIDHNTLRDYRTMQLLNFLKNDIDIVCALAYKKSSFSVIEKYVVLNTIDLPRIESDELFRYRVSMDVWYLEMQIKDKVINKIITISESEDFRKYKSKEFKRLGKMKKNIAVDYRNTRKNSIDQKNEDSFSIKIG